jgi:hypothetical protein
VHDSRERLRMGMDLSRLKEAAFSCKVIVSGSPCRLGVGSDYWVLSISAGVMTGQRGVELQDHRIDRFQT